MAKQLYDYWFVQFDFPNEEGKPYKSSGGKMVWNKTLKREIPEGWEVKKIADFCNTYSGGTPKSTVSEYYDNGDIPWINSGELNNSFITSTSNYITRLGFDNSSAKIYPTNTILVAMYGATAGKVGLLAFEACSNQAICGIVVKNKDMVYILKPYLDSLYRYFVSLSSGSARDNISQDLIRNLYMAVPQDSIVSSFAQANLNIYEQVICNQRENQLLTTQRDELLPLLMNGQVSVKQLNSDLVDKKRSLFLNKLLSNFNLYCLFNQFLFFSIYDNCVITRSDLLSGYCCIVVSLS